ncbi:hypothetical protein ROHU_026904 [Labeo rohita]|uniref:Uncharacterized protein n=1 Tax=Labeo rohita TaxID=84645 RepID=A0A498MDL8_LABRO|nr:hypothetical protein ROHU_026904 [Labeo rohita]
MVAAFPPPLADLARSTPAHIPGHRTRNRYERIATSPDLAPPRGVRNTQNGEPQPIIGRPGPRAGTNASPPLHRPGPPTGPGKPQGPPTRILKH